MIREALQKVSAGEHLSTELMTGAMEEIAEGKATPAQLGAFLMGLRLKGETVDEIAAAATVMRSRVESVKVTHPVFVDTCGTGGDGQNTFNISTASAFVVAAAGVPVAKHGNRSVSSRCGSADVLAALGVNVEIPRERVERCIADIGIGFLFAPKLHPAFGAAAGVRRELGIRTVFNLLGPMVNPAGARHQLMGVFALKWVRVVGEVLARLGASHAFVVHGDGLDEVAVTGPTEVAEVLKDGTVRSLSLTPEELGVSRWRLSDLAGGEVAHNARMLRDVLGGQKGAPRDAVLANAAGALVAADVVATWKEGVILAQKTIDGGSATAKLEQLVRQSNEI